ncbi:ribosomal large subunit pseudouridine synthase B [Caldalkalibacillus thermarum]|uniref:pseudouridine synthase n=1 Tax=Caldalkalibacillus thermarum TaxID=296745 RepID=UPI00166525C9|nr:pseudouridine synthase [Caldalkalibacillus thermarum]GGK15366.1 ribosomal large subunit pseudouridine synthase B [Caldalkalibacillus thermarum]
MERLQKVLAHAGVASRRKAEKLIEDGRVKVNGQVVTQLGTLVDPAQDKIEVDGQTIDPEPKVYYLFYKPTGVITSVQDPQGRKVVMDFFKNIPQRIYPVGRLDRNTSGLLLLTNDGELAHRLMHPSFHVDKVYRVTVKGIPSDEKLSRLERGIRLKDGWTAPAKVEWLHKDMAENKAVVRITIHEGRKRQVRRMFKAIGHPVLALHRERYAFLNLEGLNEGEYRPLTPEEVRRLKALVT